MNSLAYLINTFRTQNFNLWKVLTGLSNQIDAVVATQTIQDQIIDNFVYRFEFPTLTTGTDIYPVWKQIRFPLDSSGNAVANTGQQILRLDINAKVAPGSDCVIDILVTKDNGVTFTSLLGPTNAQKIVLPTGLSWIKYGGQYFTNNVLQDGWWFRIDCINDGGASGVEIVLRTLLMIP